MKRLPAIASLPAQARRAGGFAALEKEMQINLLKNSLLLATGALVSLPSPFGSRFINSCKGFYLRKKDLDTPSRCVLMNE
jgi:hypothetical protein